MLDQLDFTGKVAVITGAASGVGRQTALNFAALGADVALLDINEAGLKETAELLAADTKSEVFATDISDHEVCKATIDKIAEQFGRIDVLANIAGMMSLNRIEDITPQLWKKMFAVNVDGAFFLSQAALPHLRKTEGNIVNVASNTGISGAAYLSHYAATKHAVVGMTKAMAYELIKEKVRVNAVAPGGINTAMTAAPQMPEDADWDLINRIVSPRGVTEPEEVAHLIAYIASPLAHSIFGACYSIDLGLTI